MSSANVSLPLSVSRIQSLLATRWMGVHIHVYGELDSTNTRARELANSGAPHGSVVLAEMQRAGRGRQNRTWFSPAFVNIYCSIIVKHAPPPIGIPWIPLVTGIGIVEALESSIACSTMLKWPNDMLIGTKKVGGILCEIRCDPEEWTAVLGFGLNVNLEHRDLPPDLQEVATSVLIETGQHHDRNALLACILTKLEWFYDRLLTRDLAFVRQAYIGRCTTLGHHVHVHLSNGDRLQGLAVDITPDGALRVKTGLESSASLRETGMDTFLDIHAGDVTHVRKHSSFRRHPMRATSS